MTPADIEELRQRLAAERTAILGEMVFGDNLAPGLLSLMSGVQATVAAADAVLAEERHHALMEEVEHLPGRVVIQDAPGEPLMLLFYPSDGGSVRASISAEKAIALAAGLTSGALRRWPRDR